jgi:hypothetical protein
MLTLFYLYKHKYFYEGILMIELFRHDLVVPHIIKGSPKFMLIDFMQELANSPPAVSVQSAISTLKDHTPANPYGPGAIVPYMPQDLMRHPTLYKSGENQP